MKKVVYLSKAMESDEFTKTKKCYGMLFQCGCGAVMDQADIDKHLEVCPLHVPEDATRTAGLADQDPQVLFYKGRTA